MSSTSVREVVSLITALHDDQTLMTICPDGVRDGTGPHPHARYASVSEHGAEMRVVAVLYQPTLLEGWTAATRIEAVLSALGIEAPARVAERHGDLEHWGWRYAISQ